jgi:CBS domain-containing protein
MLKSHDDLAKMGQLLLDSGINEVGVLSNTENLIGIISKIGIIKAPPFLK